MRTISVDFRHTFTLIILSVALLFCPETLVAEANPGPLKIKRITPAGEDVPRGRQIVFQFNQNMVPLGRMERRADEVPITVDPAPDCQWRWLNSRSLACQLNKDKALKPSTRYTVQVNTAFRSVEGHQLQKPVTHTFITQRPKLRRSYFKTWLAPGMPVIRITFDQAVRPESVGQHLFLSNLAGERIPLIVKPDKSQRKQPAPGQKGSGLLETLQQWWQDGLKQLSKLGRSQGSESGEGGRHWQLQPQAELPLDQAFKLMIEPGLQAVEGKQRGIERRVVKTFHTFPPFAFLGIRCTSNTGKTLRLRKSAGDPVSRCNPQRGVALMFSTPINKTRATKNIHWTPDLAGGRKDYDPWANSYADASLSRAHKKGRSYSLYLPMWLKAYETYTLAAKAGDIRDAFDRPLAKDIDSRFNTDHRRPRLHLEHKFSTLESGVDTHLPVVVTNLESLNLSYDILTTDGRTPNNKKSIDLYKTQDLAYAYPIKVRDLIEADSGALQGYWGTTPELPGYKPRYRKHRWFFSQVTPFHTQVKLGHYNSLVWVTDFATGQPVANARVSIYVEPFGRFSKQPSTLAEATTDESGIAMLPGTEQLDPELKVLGNWNRFKPHLFVRVDKDKQLALVPLIHDFRVYAYGAQQRYIPTQSRKRHGHIRSWGFTAQGVYRAGDEIEYKLYVRDQDNQRFKPAPLQGYRLKIMGPTGKTVHQVKDLRLSGFGAHHGRFTVPKTGAVGWYRFELSAKFTQQRWYPLRVLVSDFTPAPFRVSSALNGNLFTIGDQVKITTQAKLHAGGPYARAQTRVTAQLRATPLRATDPALKAYRFDVIAPGTTDHTVHQSQGSVDDRGELQTPFTLPDNKVVYGQLTVESAVRDDRGKYIASTQTAAYAGRDRYVGLYQKDWVLKANTPAEINTLVIDQKGQVVVGTAVDAIIEHRETHAARVKSAGNAYLTQYTHKWVKVGRCQHTSKKTPGRCALTPKKSGYYRITARIKDSRGREHSSQLTRWVMGPGVVLWESSADFALDVTPQKTEYKVGDTARFLVQNPYPGAQALITLERFGVQKSWVQTLKGSSEIIEVPISQDSLPGFYLSVVVMSPRVDKPLGEGNVDLGKPSFRMGYVRVPVKDPSKELAVTITPSKKEYRPRDTVSVKLHTGMTNKQGPVELAVAVIDEAVFDLIQGGRRYYDPYTGFYNLESLDVRNYNLLARLIGLQKFEEKGAVAGGDGGGADLSLRSLFKFVSYWNPAIKPDTQGNAKIEFKAPDNLTGWRVLAIAVNKNDRMGLGEGSFKVNRPTEIRPALPNQLTEGDHLQARFTVMNRSDKPRQLDITLQAQGALTPKGSSTSQSIQLDTQPYQRYPVTLAVQAGAKGDITFKVQAGDDKDQDAIELKLPVKRKQALLTAAQYGSSTGKAQTDVLFPKNIRTDVGGLSVTASPTIIGAADGAFRYMQDYPYSCWEQKLSKAVMAGLYGDLRQYLDPKLTWPKSKALANDTLKVAADHQAPNGGMVYYKPLDPYVDPYLSAYTALAFNWLRDSGYKIPQQVESRLHDYLLRLLRKNVFPDFYSKGMGSSVRAVALAALAPHKKINRDDLLRYKPHLATMDLFGKAHYLQALKYIKEDALKKDVLDQIQAHRNESAGKLVYSEDIDVAYQRLLSSTPRTQCAVLSALIDNSLDHSNADSDDPARLLRSIVANRKRSDRWQNTQENMFCMNALANYARRYENKKPKLKLSAFVDQTLLGKATFNGFRDPVVTFKKPIGTDDPGQQRKVKIEATGQGRYYFTTRLQYSPQKLPSKATNAGMEIHREYSVERKGKWTLLKNNMNLKLGDLVRVDLYLRLPAARNFVVIDDPVPGGLEPVNRDLATTSLIDANKAKMKYADGAYWFRFNDWRSYGYSHWSFYHRELRHDSVRFYSEYLPGGNYHVAYTAQVIAPGEFTVLPTRAEEMYSPDVFGLGVPGRLRVYESK
ncbi:MAG: large extracellular alpha-helical protein [Gammaproteobacteria bacterium]|nr:large extracellular alpha-helical protein [Gammaproteobacteria bacterium]